MPASIPELVRDLRAARLPFTESEPLARHTTFRIGGPAAVFCCPQTVAELTRTLELCRAHGVRLDLGAVALLIPAQERHGHAYPPDRRHGKAGKLAQKAGDKPEHVRPEHVKHKRD